MRVFADETIQASNKIDDISQAYNEARAAMKSPTDIDLNRTQRANLAFEQKTGLARHDAEIAELDSEYDQFWVDDVTAMRSYEEAARAALARMPSWREPPWRASGLANIRERGG